MENESKAKSNILTRSILIIVGLLFLYGTFRYGVLGLLTGQTELVLKYHPNLAITTQPQALIISLLTIILGGFITLVILSRFWSEKMAEKFLQNRLIQVLFLASLVGYILMIFYSY